MTSDLSIYELLTEQEAARVLGVSIHKLRQDRVKGFGIRFCKIGRCVRYRASDIEAFIDANTFQSTTQADSQ